MLHQLPARAVAVLTVTVMSTMLVSFDAATAQAAQSRIDFSNLNFVVSIAKAPPSATASPSTCVTSGATKRCTSGLVINAVNVSLPGVMVDTANHLNGQISATCNLQATGSMSATVPTDAPANGVFDDPAASFSGEQQCTFTANFGDSSLSGSYLGSYSMSYQNGSGTQTGNDAVTVVSGTGDFAGYVGDGKYSYSAPYSLHFGSGTSTGSSTASAGTTGPSSSPGATPTAGSGTTTTTTPTQQSFPPAQVGRQYTLDYSSGAQSITITSGSLPPGLSVQGAKISGTPTQAGSFTFAMSIVTGSQSHTVSGTITVSAASTTSTTTPTSTNGTSGISGPSGVVHSSFRLHASGATGTMHLKLHKGTSSVVIVSPGSHLSKASDAGLLVTTSKGKTCSATAISGGHKIALGAGKVTAATGKLLLRAKLRSALSVGTWTITVKCGITTTSKKVIVS